MGEQGRGRHGCGEASSGRLEGGDVGTDDLVEHGDKRSQLFWGKCENEVREIATVSGVCVEGRLTRQRFVPTTAFTSEVGLRGVGVKSFERLLDVDR